MSKHSLNSASPTNCFFLTGTYFSDPFSTFKLLPLGLHPPSTTGLGLGIPCIQSSVFFLINFYWQGCIFWNLPLCLEGRNPSPTFYLKLPLNWGLPRGLVVKNLPVNAGDLDLIPGLGRFPRGGQATHSSILAWERSLARQQSTGSQRVGHNWAPEHARTHTHAPNYDVENGIPGELELPNNKFGSIRSKHIYTSNHDVENDMPRGLTLPNNKFSLIQNKHIHTPNYDVGNGIPGRLELPNNKFGLIQNKECHLLKDHLAL